MPREVFGPDYQFLRRDELLTYEEIARVARVLVGLGVEKIRITGGERRWSGGTWTSSSGGCGGSRGCGT
ncbi:hypothetical protein O0235_10495 [Tepidiforma flava]|uniref:Biotin synthase n=1 Tax=Tepidiforma flava TaxID=3004094 RepID=A0ABY7M4Y2_9CHLR|nr:hypothetical protein O0235_10495 [Tepidiforma flava]